MQAWEAKQKDRLSTPDAATIGNPVHDLVLWDQMALDLDLTYDFYGDHRLPIHSVDEVMNNGIALFEGDITTLEIDMIVNPGNQTMTEAPGISAEIFKVAGLAFRGYCVRMSPCDIGKAMVINSQGWIHSKFIIHVACPEIRPNIKPTAVQRIQLENCYRSALKEAVERNVFGIAFPVFDRYPLEEGVEIACSSIYNFLADPPEHR